MWTRLVIIGVFALAPLQAGKLELNNVRPTFGVLGAPRPDTKVLPGDIFWLAFDMDNVKVAADGKAVYSMGVEFLQDGKVLVGEKDKDRPLTAENSLGGNRLPVFAKAEVGLDTKPGEYTMRVTVTDHTAKASAVVERKFQVQPVTFGLVRVGTSYDPAANMPAPMVGVPGQFMHVNFVVVGFDRDKSKKQPNLHVEMTMLDDKGKPVLATPESGDVPDKKNPNNVPENFRAIPMQFPLTLNRPGKFTVELKATDLITKKTATARFPLTVLPNDK
jgi:hypothetical protein